MIYLIFIPILLILFLTFNIKLWFYKDKNTYDINPNLDALFDQRAKPINIINNNDKAIIFIHGFPSTPWTYDYSIKRAVDDGFDVFAPLLPGFGTSLEEFYETYYTQWFNYLCRYYEKRRKNYKEFYIVGMSMGGALSLNLNEKYDNTNLKPTATAVIAAPISMHSPLLGIYSPISIYLMRTLALFKNSMNAQISYGSQEDPDVLNRWIGYNGLYLRQGISLLGGLKNVKKDLKKITEPLLLIHDKSDTTVAYNNMKYIAKKVSSKKLKTITSNMDKTKKHSKHILLAYFSTRDWAYDEIMKFFRTVLDE